METAREASREISSGLRIESEKTADVEFFIRKTFQTDVRLGCELLYRHYYQPLCSHAIRFLYSKAVAEDLVSEIFYQFYQKGIYREITTSYRAYLYKTVRHRAYNYLRKETNCLLNDDSLKSFSDDTHQQPDAILQYEELYQDVEKAINSLPGQCRKIYLMHRFEGKKYAQIATELHLSPKTVEVQIRKASHALKDLLQRKWKLLTLTFLIDRLF
ncbi:RNA polymerase sigma-70 factor [Rhodocytophaga rosea]|nr:RNA polymerase sigma-70 factor [Rhodocytophaga rosea]